MLPSLEAISLTKQYGDFTALSNLNLKVEGAKCVGLLGPNGAGKTTTLKIFTDMIRATEGQALINGIPVNSAKREALKHCGNLIESPEIYPALTPRQALSMITELRGINRADRSVLIEDALAEVRMLDSADKKIGKLSKGMKQRVNLAAALITQPEILLLDEPTTGLDPRGMTEIRSIVKSLKNRNRLIFMSSHLLNEVEEVCDEVAIIDNGKLQVYDTLENVTSRFSGKNGTASIDVHLSRKVDDPNIVKKISEINNVAEVIAVDPKTLRIKISSDPLEQEKILKELGTLDIGVIGFNPTVSLLEDTYLNLIKERGD